MQAYSLFRLQNFDEALAAVQQHADERAVARLTLQAQLHYRMGSSAEAIRIYHQLFKEHKVRFTAGLDMFTCILYRSNYLSVHPISLTDNRGSLLENLHGNMACCVSPCLTHMQTPFLPEHEADSWLQGNCMNLQNSMMAAYMSSRCMRCRHLWSPWIFSSQSILRVA